MSEQAHSVAIVIGEDILLGDSSMPEEAERVAIPSEEGIPLGDSSQSQLQEISVNHENISEEADRAAIPLGEDILLGGSSLPEEAGRVAISSGEGVLPRDSSLPEEADIVAISSEGVLPGDSSQSQQQEFSVKHGPHMSIEDLLKVIKGANGMPVLFVPSSDGGLAAVAIDGLQSLMPAKREGSTFDEKKEQAFRSWLLLLASLVATVTFTAGLTPPGGFWAADDKANGYVAGTSVMRDKFHRRYFSFYCSNVTAFSSALMVIAMLASNQDNTRMMLVKKRFFAFLVVLCFVSLEISYMTGTWSSTGQHWSNTVQQLYGSFMLSSVFGYLMVQSLNAVAPVVLPETIRRFFFGQ